ncbi:MAG: glycosyltransferase family 2 protein [Streptosporangiaceae bacterium]
MSRAFPLVSVIVPTLNRPAELPEALASIAAQQDVGPGDMEVIVVNDGGTPAGAAAEAARERGLPVTVLDHPRRLGLPSARNTGLDQARGRYAAFLDDDDVLLPRHLATALAALESGTDGVITTCLVSEQRTGPAGPPPGAVPWDVGFDPLLLEACNLLPVHAAVFRRPDEARLDPALPSLEDWDFWLRLVREHRYRFTRVDEPTAVYHRLPASGSMITAIADGAAPMAEFSALVRRTWARWPATTPRSARFRSYLGIMYWQALSLLATGQAPDPHYYLRTVQALEHAWHHPGAEASLPELIALAVRGEPADDRHAA